MVRENKNHKINKNKNKNLITKQYKEYYSSKRPFEKNGL